MTFGQLQDWMIEENRPFALAVAKYYSIAKGDSNAAAIGEIAYWQASGQVLQSLVKNQKYWSDEDRAFYLKVIARVRQMEGQTTRAAWAEDDKYLRKLAAGMKLLKQRNQRAEKEPEKYEFKAVEWVFEAYLHLRKKAGKGSPLPTKKEVENTAALFQAFAVTGLLAKLPKFLWNPVRVHPMPGSKLTEREFSRIMEVRDGFLQPESENAWSYRLKQAGLEHLRQESPR